MYDTDGACAIYRNFLDWLFATFRQDEAQFRGRMVERLRLQPGMAVLVTGCGLGDDIPAILDAIGPAGEVHAQDLSPAMVHAAAARWSQKRSGQMGQVTFSTGDALRLPYPEDAFDAAFHFGGINLFDDIGQGIAEMNRVVRPGGRVVVSDEGVGPWLQATDYGRMVVTNNPLWALPTPIDRLPVTAADVTLSWVLGNCFWVIEFTVGTTLPDLDPHVPHQGRRGGSMWTRYHGQLEAVTAATRDRALQAAAAAGISVHDWLERTLRRALDTEAPATPPVAPAR